MMLALLLTALCSISVCANHGNAAFRQEAASQSLFKLNVQEQQLHLSQVDSGDGFTTLTHPSNPSTWIRVKKTDWCDPTVNVYTGYLDVSYGAKHLWFYFFESRSDTDTDDVVMWINGGPGSSSSTGLLMEQGPCQIDMKNVSSNGTIWNPYAWNDRANIFFLDQPVGVGFSYADYGEHVDTTEEAAQNVASFLSLWFEAFPQFAGRALHLSGESYGGRYLPVMAAEVYSRNEAAIAAGSNKTLNLQSVIIGNGITDISTLYEGRYAIECGTAALDVPFQDIRSCVRMKTALPRCQKGLNKYCIDAFDEMDCRASVTFCEYEMGTALRASGRNNFDVSKQCEGKAGCYVEQDAINSLLSNTTIQSLLGVESQLGNYTATSDTVYAGFNSNFDKWRVHTQYYVSNLLDRGVRVLIYAGTYDWQCNWVANYLWTEKLEWSDSEEYQVKEMRDWKVDGSVAGKTKSAGKLTFASIYGAGHLVPHDKPLESLVMLNRWLSNESL